MITPIDATNIIKTEMFEFDTDVNNYQYYAQMVNTNAVVHSVKLHSLKNETPYSSACVSSAWVSITKELISRNRIIERTLSLYFMNMFNSMGRKRQLNSNHNGKKIVNITSGR